MENDFKGEWGDRRQEVLLIGDGVDIDGLTACLDSCLLTAMRTDINEEKRDELLSELFGDRWEE